MDRLAQPRPMQGYGPENKRTLQKERASEIFFRIAEDNRNGKQAFNSLDESVYLYYPIHMNKEVLD